VSAVDVRIAEAAVVRIEELGQAGVADRQVRRYSCRRLVIRFARADGESRDGRALTCFNDDRGDARRGRRTGAERGHEGLDRRLAAFNVNPHAVVAVEHPPGDSVFTREPVDPRPKADALHDATDLNPACDATEVANGHHEGFTAP